MRWHALLIAPSRESIAQEGLKRRDYHVYWPNYLSCVRTRSGRAPRQRSVLPGYMLIRVAMPDWSRVLESPGVREVIRDADSVPVPISEEDIAVIIAIEAAHVADAAVAERGVPFRVGQRVRVRRDMLNNWKGTILHIDKRKLCTVEIAMLLGRATRVVVPVAELEAA